MKSNLFGLCSNGTICRAILAVSCCLVWLPIAQGQTLMPGIDVSHWQGTVNWTSVKNAGYKFAFMKATEDTNYTDPQFAANITNATANGLAAGPYHFCRLDTNSADPATDAANEANYFLGVIKPYYKSGLYLPPVADVEGFPTGLTTSQLQTLTSTWVQSFSDTIYNALGVRPIVYGSKSKVNSYYTSSVAAGHELWLAWWRLTGTTQPPVASDTPLWGIWQFWQWSDGADSIAQASPVPGIAGNVDRDVYYGTQAQLDNLRIGFDGAMTGDYNRDGNVAASDYITWRKQNGQTVPIYSGADGNGNAQVGPTDYNLWRSNYGKTSGAGASDLVGAQLGIPEPHTWALAVFSLCRVVARRQERRHVG